MHIYMSMYQQTDRKKHHLTALTKLYVNELIQLSKTIAIYRSVNNIN